MIAGICVETGIAPSELLDGPDWLIPAIVDYLADRNQRRKG